MIPYLSIEVFRIGPLTIYSWGFFIALAFLAGLVLAIWQGKKIGVEARKIFYLVIFIYLGAMLGARLFFILQRPAEFFSDPLMFFRIGEGGMMFYGGLFGGLLAGRLFIKKWVNCWALISILTPVIPLTLAIGRIGCFLSNDHLGGLTSLPWAISWPNGTLRHPVALYLILFDLALAGFLWWYKKVPPFVKGGVGGILDTKINPPQPSFTKGGSRKTFLLFLFLYPLGRFLLDFTRNVSADPHYWGLAVSQWISLSLLTALILYVILRNLKKTKFLSESRNN